MRLIVWLLLILSRPGGLAEDLPPAEIPTEISAEILAAEGLWPGRNQGQRPTTNLLEKDAEASTVGSAVVWRRTRDGWERPSQWSFRRRSQPPALHPVVVGLLEAFLAAAALIAFSEAGDPRPGPKSKPACRFDPRHR